MNNEKLKVLKSLHEKLGVKNHSDEDLEFLIENVDNPIIVEKKGQTINTFSSFITVGNNKDIITSMIITPKTILERKKDGVKIIEFLTDKLFDQNDISNFNVLYYQKKMEMIVKEMDNDKNKRKMEDFIIKYEK